MARPEPTAAAPDLDARLRMLALEGRLPRHVAIIMDGNGRWAQARSQPREQGHRVGAESVRSITRMARQLGLETLTLYAFSEQNWSRPKTEVEALLSLLVEFLTSELPEMRRTDIRLQAIGNLAKMPLPVRMGLETTMAATRAHRSMTLALCLSYGGREEIVHAARMLARQVAKGELRPDDIDEARFEQQLWTAPLASPPDLIIRTSGEQRLSNFLCWQSAYSEFYFTPVEWPDFREDAFAAALIEYARRERRFGGLGAGAKG